MRDELPLTVRQLIEMLSQCDPDAPVMVECEDDYYSGPLTKEDVKPTGNSVHRYAPHRGKDFEPGPGGKWVERERDYPGGLIIYSDKEEPRDDLPWIDRWPCVVFRC